MCVRERPATTGPMSIPIRQCSSTWTRGWASGAPIEVLWYGEGRELCSRWAWGSGAAIEVLCTVFIMDWATSTIDCGKRGCGRGHTSRHRHIQANTHKAQTMRVRQGQRGRQEVGGQKGCARKRKPRSARQEHGRTVYRHVRTQARPHTTST